MTEQAVLDWLLEGDPAIRWQVMRDLLDRPAAEWRPERARVASEGWGRELLRRQDPDGTWAQSLYFRKWTSTHYTLLLLRSLGLPQENEAARRAAALLFEEGVRPDGGLHFAKSQRHSETCITGMGLAICAYFQLDDPRLHALVDHLERVQTPDGGWNCQWVRGSKHGSFHTTVSVLEGLAQYTALFPDLTKLALRLQAEGREFLLAHRLFRSHRTGEVVSQAFTRFSFPPHWHYDVLRALDYLREASDPGDGRLAEAVELVRKRRQADGRWKLQNRHAGASWYEMEQVGQPSRWNTLRALRVLRWWEGQ